MPRLFVLETLPKIGLGLRCRRVRIIVSPCPRYVAESTMKLDSRTHTTPTDQSISSRVAFTRDMIEPLDPRILSALLRDDDDDGNKYVPMAKRCLNENRNLSAGVSHLLDTYKAFQAHLWQHDIPCGHERGADSWHIEFLVRTQCQFTASSTNHRAAKDPPFSNLRIYSTSFEGVIDVHVRNKPFLSIRIFDHPQNWQALLQWLWEYGDRCQIARSLLPLDPQKLSAIHIDSNTPSDGSQADGHAHTGIDAQGTDDTFHSTIGAARRALAKNGTGEGMYKLLLAFQNFKPSLHWDRSSAWHADVGYEKWHISFSVRCLVSNGRHYR